MRRSFILWFSVLALIIPLKFITVITSAEAEQTPASNVIDEGGVRYHVVVRGDTLWDISEHYFGNPFDWPKLWQWNTQILNPHWIYPRDKIRLTPFPMIEAEEEKVAPVPVAPLPTTEEKAPKPPEKYFLAMGNYGSFISPVEIQPAGYIQRGVHPKPLLGDKDTLYISEETGTGLKPGALIFAYEQSGPVYHPMSRKFIGYIINLRGKIAVRDFRDGFYEAFVEEAYQEIPIKIPVALFNISSPKIKIIEDTPLVEGSIIATASKKIELSKNDLIFLDRGRANGLEMGHNFPVFISGDTIQTYPNGEKAQLPSRRIGKLIIVGVMDKTSTAVIMESDEPIHVGDTFRSQMK